MSNRIDLTMRGGQFAIHVHDAELEVNAVLERVGGVGHSESFVGVTLANPEHDQRVQLYLHDPAAVRTLADDLTAAADEIEKGKLCLNQ